MKPDIKVKRMFDNWSANPLAFAREAFEWKEGERLTTQQVEFLKHVAKLKATKLSLHYGRPLDKDEEYYKNKIGFSIRAGRGTGKDAALAILIIWFSIVHNDYKGFVTAPSGGQLQDVLWAEIGKWLNRCKLKDVIEKQKIKLFRNEPVAKEWFISGRTLNKNASPEEQAETLSGRHEDFMLLAVDEASGVPDPVFIPVESSLTGKMNFAVIISNPTRRTGYFYHSHTRFRDSWIALHWNAEESEIVPKHKIESARTKYGAESNYYRVNILGEFAVEDDSTLIPYDWIMNSLDREIDVPENEKERWGVDVATSEGVDKSVLIKMKGWKVLDIIEYPKIDTMALCGWVALEDTDNEADAINIDTLGVGDGVFHRLREIYRAKHRYKVIQSVKVSEKCLSETAQKRFYRLRDELYWNLREAFEKGLVSIPTKNKHTDDLIGQLTSIRIKDTEWSSGLIKIESKKDMKNRGLKSPDLAEALILSGYKYGKIEIDHRKKDAWDDNDDIYDFTNYSNPSNAWMGV